MGCTQSQEKTHSLNSAKKQPSGLVISVSGDTSDEHFSHAQKQILRETWQHMAGDKQRHGMAIFRRIFEREPVTKRLFPFRDLEGDALTTNPLFRSHAMRFMNAVECTIVNLDALDLALVPILHRLGEKHVHMVGFKQEYFTGFMESITDVVAGELGERCTGEVREAWRHLGNFVADKMMEGYSTERQQGMENQGMVGQVDRGAGNSCDQPATEKVATAKVGIVGEESLDKTEDKSTTNGGLGYEASIDNKEDKITENGGIGCEESMDKTEDKITENGGIGCEESMDKTEDKPTTNGVSVCEESMDKTEDKSTTNGISVCEGLVDKTEDKITNGGLLCEGSMDKTEEKTANNEGIVGEDSLKKLEENCIGQPPKEEVMMEGYTTEQQKTTANGGIEDQVNQNAAKVTEQASSYRADLKANGELVEAALNKDSENCSNQQPAKLPDQFSSYLDEPKANGELTLVEGALHKDSENCNDRPAATKTIAPSSSYTTEQVANGGVVGEGSMYTNPEKCCDRPATTKNGGLSSSYTVDETTNGGLDGKGVIGPT